MRQFVARVLGSTGRTWSDIFAAAGRTYETPTLVLFSDAVESACGFAQAAAGPFYCGSDHKIYIDLSFYRDLRQRFQAPGDFAQAYVIAHEVGHHVQNLLGIMTNVQSLQRRASSRSDANALSVRLELQADCLAGIWASHANRERNILEPGDVEEGLNAAAQIGDDRMQKRAQGYVVPEGFTHGSAEQRVQWFRRGIETADVNQCDTFARRPVS
jgi:predicted metalloprotease